jgi:mannose-1-phosphate guanylyltransferase
MVAKKQHFNSTSNIHISMTETAMIKTDEEYLGKVRSNFTGSSWQVFGRGNNPKKQGNPRSEQAVITYDTHSVEIKSEQEETKVMGVKDIEVMIPSVDREGKQDKWVPVHSCCDGMAAWGTRHIEE